MKTREKLLKIFEDKDNIQSLIEAEEILAGDLSELTQEEIKALINFVKKQDKRTLMDLIEDLSPKSKTTKELYEEEMEYLRERYREEHGGKRVLSPQSQKELREFQKTHFRAKPILMKKLPARAFRFHESLELTFFKNKLEEMVEMPQELKHHDVRLFTVDKKNWHNIYIPNSKRDEFEKMVEEAQKVLSANQKKHWEAEKASRERIKREFEEKRKEERELIARGINPQEYYLRRSHGDAWWFMHDIVSAEKLVSYQGHKVLLEEAKKYFEDDKEFIEKEERREIFKTDVLIPHKESHKFDKWTTKTIDRKVVNYKYNFKKLKVEDDVFKNWCETKLKTFIQEEEKNKKEQKLSKFKDNVNFAIFNEIIELFQGKFKNNQHKLFKKIHNGFGSHFSEVFKKHFLEEGWQVMFDFKALEKEERDKIISLSTKEEALKILNENIDLKKVNVGQLGISMVRLEKLLKGDLK